MGKHNSVKHLRSVDNTAADKTTKTTRNAIKQHKQIRGYKDKLRRNDSRLEVTDGVEVITDGVEVITDDRKLAALLTSKISFGQSAQILPGIDREAALELRMSDMRIEKAFVLLGKFISLGRDPVLFQTWLHEAADVSLPDTQLCCDALARYSLVYLNK